MGAEDIKVGAYIGVRAENFNMFVPLERRITFLRGDSGVGKTSFVEYIDFILENGESADIILQKPEELSVMVVNNASLKEMVKSLKNHIIVVDGTVNSEKVAFTNALMKYVIKNNLYVIIISRVDTYFDMGNKESSVDVTILKVEKVQSSIEHNVVFVAKKSLGVSDNVKDMVR